MKNQKSNTKPPPSASKKKDRAAGVANTFEWVISALAIALAFRAFAVEAFRIPTGSMADTLMGAHFQLRCPQCGYEYEYGYTRAQDRVPPGPEPIGQPVRCPSCGYYNSLTQPYSVAKGDRILVLKCLYQFAEPKRWDVVVFKNPTQPTENYIKRLIGLPGEEVQIIDGDVYIDGRIARKPPQVQKELWMPVHDFDFQPVDPNVLGAFNGSKWTPPFNFGASAWKIGSENRTQLVLDCPADQINTLTYGAASANDFRAIGSYNEASARFFQGAAPCSDLMVRFYVTPDRTAGRIGITLSKYGVDYKAWYDLAGRMVIAKVENGQETVLKEMPVGANHHSLPLMEFAVVDHQLLFDCHGSELQVDLGRSPDALHRSNQPPRVDIFGSGKLTLSHVAIFRDIYYTATNRPLRATEGYPPFRLGKDEFLMLGDNSPNSQDSRYWPPPTMVTKGMEPSRAGVVPRYYLVGKAVFVYWPSGFEFPWPRSLKDLTLQSIEANPRNIPARLLHLILTLRWIPNVGQMRFIYGGDAGSTSPEAAPSGSPVPTPPAQDSDTSPGASH